MAGTTDDPSDPGLARGIDRQPQAQQDKYLVLSAEERARGFVRPFRDCYRHDTCGQVTTMSRAIAETYARQPDFYGGTYCVTCRMHRPVGEDGGEFTWLDGSRVGT